jgi:hypothetical protein
VNDCSDLSAACPLTGGRVTSLFWVVLVTSCALQNILYSYNLHPTVIPLESPITTNLPSNLIEWREYCSTSTFTVWEPLKDWFRSEGLHAFDIKGDMSLRVKPPVDELRTHDGVVYGTHYHPPNRVHEHRVCEYTLLRSVRADVVRRDRSIVLLINTTMASRGPSSRVLFQSLSLILFLLRYVSKRWKRPGHGGRQRIRSVWKPTLYGRRLPLPSPMSSPADR